MNVTLDILKYLRSPHFIDERPRLNRTIFVVLAKIIMLQFVIISVGYICFGIYFSILGIDRPRSTINSLEFLNIEALIVAVFLFPFREELMCRIWLGFNWGILFIAPMFVIYITLTVGRDNPGVRPVLYFVNLVFFLVYFISLWKFAWKGQIQSFVKFVFPVVFWVSVVGFSLLHLDNYDSNQLGAFSLLLVWPQFVAGATYGYVRMKFGFTAALGCHGAWNALLISVSFIGLFLLN